MTGTEPHTPETKQIQKYWTIPELKLAMQLWRDGETREHIADALGRTLGSVHDQIQRNRAMFPRRIERGTKAEPIKHIEMKIMIPVAMHAKLKRCAGAEGVSMSKFIREAVKAKL